MADDPAHRLITRPMETTSAWPWPRIVSTVLPTRLLATSSLKMVFRNSRTWSLTWSIVPGREVVRDDEADHAEQRQQQRRGGQRAPERGLRAQPEQRVAPGLAQRAAARSCASGAAPSAAAAASGRCRAGARGSCTSRPVRSPAGAMHGGVLGAASSVVAGGVAVAAAPAVGAVSAGRAGAGCRLVCGSCRAERWPGARRSAGCPGRGPVSAGWAAPMTDCRSPTAAAARWDRRGWWWRARHPTSMP